MSIQFQRRYLLEDEGLRLFLDEMSSTGGGVAAGGAEFKSGTGMEYTTKDDVDEDAPMLAAGEANLDTLTQDGFTKAKRKKLHSIDVKDLWNEARNYHEFKKEAAIRTKPQQMHEAAKIINKKLEEINKLLEYTSQMKNELSEGEEQMEYKHNTKKLFEKINTRVVEAYTKLKKIK